MTELAGCPTVSDGFASGYSSGRCCLMSGIYVQSRDYPRVFVGGKSRRGCSQRCVVDPSQENSKSIVCGGRDVWDGGGGRSCNGLY